MTANDLKVGDVLESQHKKYTITNVDDVWIAYKREHKVVVCSQKQKKDIQRYLEYGTWKLIPASLDILAQLREALGWGETGTLEDVIEVLRVAKKLALAIKDYDTANSNSQGYNSGVEKRNNEHALLKVINKFV